MLLPNELRGLCIGAFIAIAGLVGFGIALTQYRTHRIAAHEQRQTMLNRHLDLARAILVRDPVAARAAMEAHFDESIGQQLLTKEKG